mgnify:CR=1 FL=1
MSPPAALDTTRRAPSGQLEIFRFARRFVLDGEVQPPQTRFDLEIRAGALGLL